MIYNYRATTLQAVQGSYVPELLRPVVHDFLSALAKAENQALQYESTSRLGHEQADTADANLHGYCLA